MPRNEKCLCDGVKPKDRRAKTVVLVNFQMTHNFQTVNKS